MKKILLFALGTSLLALNGCGSMVVNKCVTFQPKVVTTKYDKIKKIAVEEAANYGFDKLTTEVKPTKYNDFEGTLVFNTKTSSGIDTLNINIKQDNICFHGGGTVAKPDTAIKAILERYQHL